MLTYLIALSGKRIVCFLSLSTKVAAEAADTVIIMDSDEQCGNQ